MEMKQATNIILLQFLCGQLINVPIRVGLQKQYNEARAGPGYPVSQGATNGGILHSMGGLDLEKIDWNN